MCPALVDYFPQPDVKILGKLSSRNEVVFGWLVRLLCCYYCMLYNNDYHEKGQGANKTLGLCDRGTKIVLLKNPFIDSKILIKR